MVQLEIYSTEWCPYCQRALRLLDSKNVPYKKIDLDLHPHLKQEMIDRAGRSSVPQIFVDNQPLGGYDDIALLDAQRRLDPLLGLTAGPVS